MTTLCTILIPQYQQEPLLVWVTGDYTSGNHLADAVIAAIPAGVEWQPLFVTVQVFAFGEQGRQKTVTGAFGLRSQINREFAGLKQRTMRSVSSA